MTSDNFILACQILRWSPAQVSIECGYGRRAASYWAIGRRDILPPSGDLADGTAGRSTDRPAAPLGCFGFHRGLTARGRSILCSLPIVGWHHQPRYRSRPSAPAWPCGVQGGHLPPRTDDDGFFQADERDQF
jgi:hypothetical protein